MQSAASPPTILDAMQDPAWWGTWFKHGDWSAWQAFLAAAFHLLPITVHQKQVYIACTGRQSLPRKKPSEIWAVCGRRSGKTRIMATVAAYLACFVEWRQHLSPGEVATVMVIAKDRRQARVAMRYLRSLILDHDVLSQLVVHPTDDALELSNQVVIEVATASFRSVRGYSIAAVIADELAFWIDDETSANPADEIIAALKPAMATLPGSLLMVSTSPYGKRGPVFETFRRSYAQPDNEVLVWKAPTRVMNPSVPQSVIDTAMERDPQWASAEYMAEFRGDLESFVAREVVEAAVQHGRHELPPIHGTHYVAFVDPSGGSSDSMTLAIGHRDKQGIVLDAIRERRAPFSPASVVSEFVQVLKAYACNKVTGDRYAGDWPREKFREHGIAYEPAEQVRSDLYLALLPALNSGQVELLDNPRLTAQLCGLERRTARSGKDSIDHPPGSHDDIANSVAGAVALLLQAALPVKITPHLMAWARTPSRYGDLAKRNAQRDPRAIDLHALHRRTMP